MYLKRKPEKWSIQMTKRIPTSLFAILLTLTLALLIASLSSCSAVFTAGISGTVETKDGTRDVPVQGVNVFVYTDKSQRDSDFTQFEAGHLTRPSQGSGYVATTTTDANGQFTVNKIVWKTNGSEFGKTADVNTVYLIFYHEDYTPKRCDATIISDSTNSSNIKMTLEPSKTEATLRVFIYDVSTGHQMTDSCTVKYTVKDQPSDTVVLTGNGTIAIKFPKEGPTDVKFELSSPGTHWKMVDKTGNPISNFSEESIGKDGTEERTVTLYMKNYEFTLPGFYGDIDGTVDTSNKTDNDNKKITLKYYDVKAKDWKEFAELKDANLKTGVDMITTGNAVQFRHGVFKDVGSSDNYTITINDDKDNPYRDIFNWDNFNGKNISVKLQITFEGKNPVEITYIPRSEEKYDLGHLELTN